MYSKSIRGPALMLIMTSLPCSVVCKSILDWIEKPLDSLWRSMEVNQTPTGSLTSAEGLPVSSLPFDPISTARQPEETITIENETEDLHDAPASQSHFTNEPQQNPLYDDSETLKDEEYDHEIYIDEDSDFSETEQVTSSPVIVYRFYAGKSNLSPRTTRYSPTAIPFLCIGPNVDHWKSVAQQLSSRGYNVIACERVRSQDDDFRLRFQQHGATNEEDSATDNARVIRKLLDALRWSHVVLVGCDAEALMAIQAALRLAPHRVVGLVLCGNLDATTKQLVEGQYQLLRQEQEQQRFTGETSLTAGWLANRNFPSAPLDRFVSEKLNCPFQIIWDGDGTAPSWPSAQERSKSSESRSAPYYNRKHAFDKHRCQIIGGGSAPHRRRPEQFAWTLSRFIEEQVAPIDIISHTAAVVPRAGGGQLLQNQPEHFSQSSEAGTQDSWKANWAKLFSPFSFTVGGRLVATAILYTVCLKVAIYQFGNFRVGFNTVASVRTRITRAIGTFHSVITLSQRESETVISDKDSKEKINTKVESRKQQDSQNDCIEKENDEQDDEPVEHDEDSPNKKGQRRDGQRYQPPFFLDGVVA
jgi:hypothetical protein